MENNNLILLACGTIGVFLHCLLKAKDLISYASKSNIKFSFIDYLAKDWISIAFSVLSVIGWFLVFGEFATKYPKILDFVRFSFMLMGWFGSYIIQKIYSRGKSYISDIIDKKTNIADALKFASEEEQGPGGSNPPPIKGDK